MRVGLYVRISEDRTGQQAGVDRQLAACIELAAKLGWTVVEVFRDNDVSAYKSGRRPGFERLLKAAGRGEFDAVIAWHPDRLYRRLRDLVRLIDINKDLQVHTVQGGNLDLSTASGRMMAGILGSVFTAESERHAERRRAANDQRARAGKWCATGGRPFGYDGAGVPIEEEAQLIRSAADGLLNRGASLKSVARQWNAVGITTTHGYPWDGRHLKTVLINPKLAGIVVHRGEELEGVTGDWVPILEPDVYHRLRDALTSQANRGAVSFEKVHLMSGVVRCGRCGQRMVTICPGRGRPTLYACRPTNHITIWSANLDAHIEDIMVGYLRGEGVGRSLRARDEKQAALSDRRVELRGQRAGLTSRLEELARLFAAGKFSSGQAAIASESLHAQIRDIDVALAESAGLDPLAALTGADNPDDTALLIERWAAAPVSVRSKLVDRLMVVTAQPRPRFSRGFDPESVTVDWKAV